MVQQNYFQICISKAKFLDVSTKLFFPFKGDEAG